MERVYIGIDWADDHHDVHVTDDSAAPLDSFSIPHSYDGMKKLRERLGKSSSDPGNVLVAVESHQGLLIYALLEAGYLCRGCGCRWGWRGWWGNRWWCGFRRAVVTTTRNAGGEQYRRQNQT